MGKQRRQAELQDKRDRILTCRKVRSYPIYWEGNTDWVASPVRLANLMKVLTSDRSNKSGGACMARSCDMQTQAR